MPHTLESHLGRFEPHQRRLLIKKAAVYAEGLGERMYGDERRYKESGEDILHITLQRLQQGDEGYSFKDGDILLFDCLCRCCRRTARSLQSKHLVETAASAVDEEDDAPAELSENAAVAFLERRDGLVDQFLVFVKKQKLKGKQRAYCLGFSRYGLEGWDAERIARDLRVTAGTIHKYRSHLRELLEQFEVLRQRRGHL
jgi:DNA-directed RNA polymerase specialized sigma24 family protein